MPQKLGAEIARGETIRDDLMAAIRPSDRCNLGGDLRCVKRRHPPATAIDHHGIAFTMTDGNREAVTVAACSDAARGIAKCDVFELRRWRPLCDTLINGLHQQLAVDKAGDVGSKLT